jgi:hypothetical protein
MKAFAVLVGFALLAGGAQAQSLKEKYELSAQCGKRAAETFRKDWKGFPSKRANYEHHHNSRLNKCFYIEITNNHERGKGPLRVMRLYDLHENGEIAGYHKWEDDLVYCWVQGKLCASEQEWRALIKQFMED